MSGRTPILVALLAAVACGSEPPAQPEPPPPPPPKAAPKVAEAAPAEVVPAVEYAYSPVGKRDPFRSTVDEKLGPAGDAPLVPNCGPLCKWELDQLRLVAVISGVSNPLAMVEDPTGRGYIVRRGTFVGKRNGKITQIRSGEVVVTEIYKDQMGKPHINPVPIKLPDDQKPGEQDDQNLLTPEVAE